MIGAQVGRVQLAVAAKLLQMGGETTASAVKLIDAAGRTVSAPDAGAGTWLEMFVISGVATILVVRAFLADEIGPQLAQLES